MASKKLRDLISDIRRGQGDAIQGERVIAEARTVGRPMVVPGTSTHRIQQVVLKTNVLCVVDKPFRLKQRPMKLKE